MNDDVEVKPKRRGRKPSATAKEYVNNAEMTRVISEWVLEIKKIEDRSNWPRMPEYLGECFLKIVNNYGNKVNFRNYTYLEDMKAEALLSCIKYAHNFDPEKSQNAFAYFTQVTHTYFLQVMEREKKQAKIKMREISEQSIYNYDNIKLYDETQE